jgi:hypothetical protein
MKVFGKHFKVDDEHNNILVTFDSSVASFFQQFEGSDNDVFGQIQYVGIVKDISKSDYGPMFSPIVLFHCSWVKNGIDNRGNPIYKQDDVGFLLPNCHHLLHEFDEPFVFPSQVQQVFFLVNQ